MRKLLLSCALFLVPASGASADTLLATTSVPTQIDAQGSRVVWSDLDTATGAFSLWTKVGDRDPERLPVKVAATPFDVDLGRTADNKEILAYSRCSATRCRIVTYDFATKKETTRSPKRANEHLPAVSGDQIAFVRRLSGNKPVIYTRPLAGGTPTRVPGGSALTENGTGPTALDFSGRLVAYNWNTGAGEGNAWELRLGAAGGAKSVLITSSRSGAMSSVRILKPTIARGKVYAAIARELAAGNRFVTYTIAGAELERTTARAHMRAVAWSRRFIALLSSSEDFATCGEQGTPCRLVRVG